MEERQTDDQREEERKTYPEDQERQGGEIRKGDN